MVIDMGREYVTHYASICNKVRQPGRFIIYFCHFCSGSEPRTIPAPAYNRAVAVARLNVTSRKLALPRGGLPTRHTIHVRTAHVVL